MVAAAIETTTWRPSAFQRVLALYVIIVSARLDEIVPGLYGLHVGKLLVALLVLLLLVQPRQMGGCGSFRERLPKRALWIVLLSVLSVVFSIYTSLSAIRILTSVLPATVAGFLIWKSVASWRHVRYYMQAFEIAGLILVGVAVANYGGGRLDLSSQAKVSYDTNDLAYVLVTILPLTLGLAATTNRWITRTWHALAAIAMAVGILLTASRGGFLALVIIPLEIVVLSSSRRAAAASVSVRPRRISGARVIAVITAAVVASIVLWSAMPNSARARILTVFSLSKDYNVNLTDTTGRLSIWDRGSDALLERPIGYGIGTFETVDGRRGGRYKAAHNIFLEVAVELGVVGLLLFILMFKAAFQGLNPSRLEGRHVLDDFGRMGARELAWSLRFAVLTTVIAGFFLSEAFSNVLWMLVGLVAGAQSVMLEATAGSDRKHKDRAAMKRAA